MLTLVQNIGLLLALTFVYSLTLPMRRQLTRRQQAILQGVIFGAFGAVSLLMPVELGGGFRFDGRNAVVVVATLFGGYVAGFITCGVIIPIRLLLGGAGAVSAAGSVLTTVLLAEWVRRRYSREGVLAPGHTLVLGIVVSIQGLAWLFLAPFDEALAVVRLIAVPLLIMNPLAMVLINALLAYEVRRVALENALRESERRLRQIAETSEQVFWTYDVQAAKLLYVSPGYSRIWQRPPDALMRDPSIFEKTIYPDDQAIVTELLENPRADRPAAEVRIVRPDGSLRWVSARTYPVVDSESGSPHIIGTVLDITDQKQAEVERLALEVERKRGAMLRQFISDASHDLRTPMTIMNTSLYLLGRAIDNERQRQYLDQVQIQVNRMARLIDDMLEITRLDSGEVKFDLKRRSLNEIARTAYERRKQEADTKERTLTLELMDDAPCIMVDESELSKAIDRVTKNAIAYTQPGGTIHIMTRQQGDSALLEVQDDGVGIAAHDLPHIFERFYRADKARGAEVGGAGLGLPIASRTLELHGGSIDVESAPGVGSTFRFVFPVAMQDDSPVPVLPVAARER